MVKEPDNLPEALIYALADSTKQAKLRTICEKLKEKGKAYSYSECKDITYLDLLMYGASGVKFTSIAKLLKVTD